MNTARSRDVLVLAGVAMLTLAGCTAVVSPAASGPTANTPQQSEALTTGASTGQPAIAPRTGRDVDRVALAGVRAIESADTTRDAGPTDALLRAAGWPTPGFAERVRQYAPTPPPGATWQLWAAHHAYVTVTTSLAGDDHPPDSASVAYRQVSAVLRPLGRDGWAGPAQTVVVFVALARVHGLWRISNIQQNTAATRPPRPAQTSTPTTTRGVHHDRRLP